MNQEEARNLRAHIIELLELQCPLLESNSENRYKYDADLIYKGVCSDPRFSQVATIGRVKLVCKEVKEEETRKLKVKDEQKRLDQLSGIVFQDSLPFWPKGKSVRESLSNNVTSILTLAEVIRVVHRLQDKESKLIKAKDPSFDYRQNLLQMASHYDNGHRLLFLDDEKLGSRIVIVMHNIRSEINGLPLFYVEWGHNLPRLVMQLLMEKYKPAGTLETTIDEQKIWLVELQRSIRKGFHCDHKLLQRSCIISPPSAEISEANEKDLKVHSSLDSKLCGHCQGRASFNCSRCKGIQYCSKECQKMDWKLHKVVCNASPIDDKNSADSIVIPVIKPDRPKFGNNKDVDPVMVETSCIGLGVSLHKQSEIAKNPYGVSRFIIKCQITMTPLEISRTDGILIYDKGKVFHRYLEISEQAAHSKIHSIVHTKGIETKGYGRLKIYLYAKREGSNVRIYTSDIPNQMIYANGGW